VFTPPLKRALQTGDLSALYAGESQRYHYMTLGLSIRHYAAYGSLITLGVGAFASLIGLGRLTSRESRYPYPHVAVPAILFATYLLGLPLIQGNRTAYMYAWYALPLAVASLAALAASDRGSVRFAGARGFAVLVGALMAFAGLAVFVLNRLPGHVVDYHLIYEWYALPFAVAGLGGVLALWRREHSSEWATFPLLALAVAGGCYFVSELGKSSQPVTDRRVVAAFHHYAPASESVLAEPVFWWVDPSPHFRSDSTIWLASAIHKWSFTASMHHICPAVIAVDDLWLNHYHAMTSFPTLAPTNPAEEGTLKGMLNNEYVTVGYVAAAGDHVTFWRRRAAECGSQAAVRGAGGA
jgi:hypothetical protein